MFLLSKRWNPIGLGFVLFILFLTIGVSRGNWETHYGTYKSPVWADGGGYYMYLPATFVLNWDATKATEQLRSDHGYGWEVRIKPDSSRYIFTKYTAGVAVLSAPFFLAVHAWKLLHQDNASGFGPDYQLAMIISACFWAAVGLAVMYKLLQNWFAPWQSLLAVLLVPFGTNFLYYTVQAVAFSHIYGFALCSIFLLILQTTFRQEGIRGYGMMGLGLVGGLALMNRPLDAPMLMSAALLLGVRNLSGLSNRLGWWLARPRAVAWIILGAIVGLLPQLIYWTYVFGTPFADSYSDEHFSNWASPYLLQVLFSPNNGLFMYAPILVLAVVGMSISIRNSSPHAAWICFSFASLVYISAAWHMPTFGCAYGLRNAVNYMPAFIFGLAGFLSWVSSKSVSVKICISLFSILSIRYTWRMLKVFDHCFYGKGTFVKDVAEWWHILIGQCEAGKECSATFIF